MTDLHDAPARDWATEFDHTKEDYAATAPQVWDELRGCCPVAHSEAHGGVWLPTRHEDTTAIAHDTEHFSSEGVIVNVFKPEGLAPMGYAPPITSDPPFHADARRLMLPAFGPKAIAELEQGTRESCRQLLDDLLADVTDENDVVDAATAYAQHIPVRVIAAMLGLPKEDGPKFRDFIHRIIEKPGEYAGTLGVEETLLYYLTNVIIERRNGPPTDDLIGYLLQAEMDGEPLTNEHIFGTIALLIIAGIDTTWSAIGASLWHLAQHPEDRQRLVEDPDVLVFAIEEFLRFYAPVTMARIAAVDTEIGAAVRWQPETGCCSPSPPPTGTPRPSRTPTSSSSIASATATWPSASASASTAAWAQPGPPRAHRGRRRVDEAHPRLRAGRSRYGPLVHRTGPCPRSSPSASSRPWSLMRATLDSEKCQGHGRCYAPLASSVFDTDDVGYAILLVEGDGTAPEQEQAAVLAAENCPEYAIEVHPS